MEHNLFLGGISIELPAQAVQVTGYHRGAFAARSPEQRVLREMGDAGRIGGFVAGAGAYSEGAVRHGPPALAHGIAQPLG